MIATGSQASHQESDGNETREELHVVTLGCRSCWNLADEGQPLPSGRGSSRGILEMRKLLRMTRRKPTELTSLFRYAQPYGIVIVWTSLEVDQ